MGISSALFQNFYMDPAEVFDAGERICSAMAGVNGCLNEAEGVFGQISSLTASVPAQARCGALISACENAISTIRNTDFSAYGSRVSQNMCKLADLSEHVAGATIKVMEDSREKLDKIRKNVADLNSKTTHKSFIALKKVLTLEGLISFYSQSPVGNNVNKYSLEYQAARYAGLQVSLSGAPVINSKEQSERYQKLVHLFMNGGEMVITNGDGSTTTFYLCDTTFREALDRQMKLNDRPQVYPTLQSRKTVDANRYQVYDAMLPFNHMSGEEMYQFLDLSNSSNVKKSDIKRMLDGRGVLDGMEDIFMKAAEDYNIDPRYLVGHSILETGNGESELANGVEVDGKIVYNMYGYGAYDSDPVKKGAEIAYSNDWFTKEEAILGGAEKISNGYINEGQSTLYEMRWDTQNCGNPPNLGDHQYATDIEWTLKQVGEMDLVEVYNQIPREDVHYYVPVYALEPEDMQQDPKEKYWDKKGKNGVVTP